MRRARILAVAVATCAAAGVLGAQDHSYTPADVDAGGRLYQSSCAGCHGPGGDGIPGVELARGQFRRATSDTDLIALIRAGIPGTAMPPHSFSDVEAARVVAYLRNMSLLRVGAAPAVLRGVGNPIRGKALFEGKGGCATCHRVRGQGPRLGPDLTEVGATRPLPELHEALVDPDATIRPANRSVRIATTDGRVLTGRLLNQDTFSVQLLDSDARLVSLPRSGIREQTFSTASEMPSYRETLTQEERDDIVGYLVSLRGFTP